MKRKVFLYANNAVNMYPRDIVLLCSSYITHSPPLMTPSGYVYADALCSIDCIFILSTPNAMYASLI